ncbi:MAG: hypothetical protein MN733_42990, partial [Nitrososphaera sp.]|nr:hypothetical protein [Nitrososphaera sp.]
LWKSENKRGDLLLHLRSHHQSDLSIKFQDKLREHERLTISELERLTEANRNTLKVRLRELAQAGQISKLGQGRATWYARKADGKGH